MTKGRVIYPPAIAPTINSGSAPVATGSGRRVSGRSCDRSRSHAKNRTNDRRQRGRLAAGHTVPLGRERSTRRYNVRMKPASVRVERP